MNEILRLKAAFEEKEPSEALPLKFFSDLELSFGSFAHKFKGSFSEARIYSCKSLFKFNHDCFKAVVSVFRFGLDVYAHLDALADEEARALSGYKDQLRVALLRFLEAFLHKSAKRVEVLVPHYRGVHDHLAKSWKAPPRDLLESNVLLKHLLLMTVDLFFFERFLMALLAKAPGLFPGFRPALVEAFRSILSVLHKENLRLPRELFEILRVFFKTFVLRIENDWNSFLPIFCDFVDLAIYFESKREIAHRPNSFAQLRRRVDLHNLILHGESENLLRRFPPPSTPLLQFKSRTFKRFFLVHFAKPNAGVVFSILKAAFRFKERHCPRPSVSLEQFAQAFFLLIEQFIFRFLDENLLARLNQLMLFLKFLCDQVGPDPVPVLLSHYQAQQPPRRHSAPRNLQLERLPRARAQGLRMRRARPRLRVLRRPQAPRDRGKAPCGAGASQVPLFGFLARVGLAGAKWIDKTR